MTQWEGGCINVGPKPQGKPEEMHEDRVLRAGIRSTRRVCSVGGRVLGISSDSTPYYPTSA
jgi:hypothetical protein